MAVNMKAGVRTCDSLRVMPMNGGKARDELVNLFPPFVSYLFCFFILI